MKVNSILFAAILAVSSVQASAMPEPEADAAAFRRFCHRPGQVCSKVKRAADAAADALAEPEPEAEAEADPWFRRFCHRPGQSCSKAKRAADALADAIADANAEADASPDAQPEPGKLSWNISPSPFFFNFITYRDLC